jgi:cellobiose-specific phosphotransferase system component IIC
MSKEALNLVLSILVIVACACVGYRLVGSLGSIIGAFVGAMSVFYYAILAFSARLEEGSSEENITLAGGTR